MSGEVQYICSTCNYTVSEEISALGHSVSSYEAKAADCTNIGWDAYEACSRCDYTTYAEISALGHSVSSCEAKAADCTNIGWNAYEICSRCDYTTYEEIPALGHNEMNHSAQQATCTAIGWNAYVTCSRCDYTTYEEIPAGHIKSDWITETEATCTADGNRYKECTVCYEELGREIIPAFGHNHVNRVCTRCGDKDISLGLAYTLSSDGTYYSVSGIGSCGDTVLVFPSTYNNLPVRQIDKSAFKGTDIVMVIIPNSITTIRSYAFDECAKLTSVIFEENSQLTRIGGDAFSGCKKLTSIIIPEKVTEIGMDAFSQCYDLASVTFENTVGWKRYFSSSSTSGTSITLTGDPAQDATKLRSTYSAWVWKRS